MYTPFNVARLSFWIFVHFFVYSVLYNIMANQLLGEDYKERLRSSARFGRDSKQCQAHFQCQELDTIATSINGNQIDNNSSSIISYNHNNNSNNNSSLSDNLSLEVKEEDWLQYQLLTNIHEQFVNKKLTVKSIFYFVCY